MLGLGTEAAYTYSTRSTIHGMRCDVFVYGG